MNWFQTSDLDCSKFCYNFTLFWATIQIVRTFLCVYMVATPLITAGSADAASLSEAPYLVSKHPRFLKHLTGVEAPVMVFKAPLKPFFLRLCIILHISGASSYHINILLSMVFSITTKRWFHIYKNWTCICIPQIKFIIYVLTVIISL